MPIRFGRLGLSTVDLPRKVDPLRIRPGMASESRVPVLQCWVNRFVTFAIGPTYYAPSLNGMAKGITGYVSRINRSVLSAAWKHRMRVSERHSSPAATASQGAGQIQIISSNSSSKKTVTRFELIRFGAPSSCLRVALVPTVRQKERLGGSLPLASFLKF